METVLYIGGAAQGKETLARRLHGPHAQIAANLHLSVRRMLEEGKDPMTLLPALRGKIVICDELGCGVIPAGAFDRLWREKTGRLCCALAEEAALVVRVTAGLPQVLKGELP